MVAGKDPLVREVASLTPLKKRPVGRKSEVVVSFSFILDTRWRHQVNRVDLRILLTYQILVRAAFQHFRL